MKTWVKVVLGAIATIVVIVASVFYLTSGVAGVGDDFFAALGKGNLDGAYADLSTDFQADTSKPELTAYLAANGLEHVVSSSWSSRAVSGGYGTLEGTVTTKDNRQHPVSLDLIKEGKDWKILAIRVPANQAGAHTGAKGLPSEKQQVALVEASIAAFVDSVAANDMTVFHDHISNLWGRQFSVAKLNAGYKGLFSLGSAILSVKTLAPAFDGPATLSDQGLMEIKGYYPTHPDRFYFDLKYIYEGTGWKLMGLAAQVK